MTVSRDDVMAYLTALGPAELQELILELEDLWELHPVYTERVEWLMGAPPDHTMGMPEHEVVLVSPGPRRVQVMKTIREVAPLSLAEVMALVDRAPSVILRESWRAGVERLKQELEALGATVEIR